MDFIMKKIIVTMIILIIFLLSSGCTTNQAINSSVKHVQPTSRMISPPTLERYSLTINPIQNFQTDSSFSINGSSLLHVSGITDFPEGTELHLDVLNEDLDSYVCQTKIRIEKNGSGPNSFSYVYNLKGNPPGQYRVIVSDNINLNSAISRFKIASKAPYYKRIQIDPVGSVTIGRDMPISGTTDMPPGSEIEIDTTIFKHPCPMHPVPDKEGQRGLCGGSCMDTGFSQQIVRVTSGAENVNIWNTTVRTNDWCPLEAYSINAKAVNYTNVTSAWTLVQPWV